MAGFVSANPVKYSNQRIAFKVVTIKKSDRISPVDSSCKMNR